MSAGCIYYYNYFLLKPFPFCHRFKFIFFRILTVRTCSYVWWRLLWCFYLGLYLDLPFCHIRLQCSVLFVASQKSFLQICLPASFDYSALHNNALLQLQIFLFMPFLITALQIYKTLFRFSESIQLSNIMCFDMQRWL